MTYYNNGGGIIVELYFNNWMVVAMILCSTILKISEQNRSQHSTMYSATDLAVLPFYINCNCTLQLRHMLTCCSGVCQLIVLDRWHQPCDLSQWPWGIFQPAAKIWRSLRDPWWWDNGWDDPEWKKSSSSSCNSIIFIRSKVDNPFSSFYVCPKGTTSENLSEVCLNWNYSGVYMLEHVCWFVREWVSE